MAEDTTWKSDSGRINEYDIYVNRSSENFIDWGKISDDVTQQFQTELERREGIKADIDDRTNKLYDSFSEVSINKDKTYSDAVVSAATQSKQNLMTLKRVYDKGQITASEYKKYLERLKGELKEWNIVTKNYGEYYDNQMARMVDDKENPGNLVASPYEIAIGESTFGYGEMYNKDVYIDPITARAFLYETIEDPNCSEADKKANKCKQVMPNFKTQQDKFLPISKAQSRMTFQSDRRQFDISLVTKSQTAELGEMVNAYVEKIYGADKVGSYIMTEEDWIKLSSKEDFQALQDNIYAQLTAMPGGRGLGETAAAMSSDFVVVLSEEQFEANCKVKTAGKCDKRYMILIDPNDPSGLTTKFGDEKFVEQQVKENIKSTINLQLGRKEKVESSISYPPSPSATDLALGEEEERQIGFLGRVHDIAVGDLNQFASGSSQGIQSINNAIRESGGSTDNMIDSITRKGDQIIIEYNNGRKQPIDRKDANGKFKTTEQLMSELYMTVIPTDSQSDKSFDDLLKMYKDSGKGISKSTRDMTDEEITTELKMKKAKENLEAKNASSTDPKKDYTPTPAELKEEMANIEISEEEITKAKTDGAITYVGDDAVSYSSRDPYKIRSAGEAVVRGEGEVVPSITGTDALREAIRPTAEGETPKTNLEWELWGSGARKKKIEGAVNKVFNAYLPNSKIRGNAKISFDADTEKLIVEYKGKTLEIKGATDVVINSNTTFDALDKMIADAAALIIKKENEELKTRGGGGGLPSAY